MISLFLLLFLLFVACIPFKKYSFEVGTFCLLAVPIELQMFGTFIPPSFWLCAGLLIVNITLSLLFACEVAGESVATRIRSSYSLQALSTQQAMIIWIIFYLIVHSLCLLWPDFIAMGERLRDYALLSEVIKYPLHPTEPWLPGENLNYYLYWYRFGAVLHQLTGLEIYELYHGLQAVTFALYVAALFRVLEIFGSVKNYLNWIYATIIAFGSNVAGLLYALKQDGQTWWGPSRVVKGAIDEFPVWSFLLGDLHPHYLNLSLLLLMLLWLFQLIKRGASAPWNLFLGVFIISSPYWVYNANAWEAPVLALLLGFTGLLFFLHKPQALWATVVTYIKSLKEVRFQESSTAIVVLCLGSFVSLYLSAKHISPGGDPFRRVTSAIPLTTTSELFLHFGFQLSAIIFSLFYLQSSWQRCLIVGLAIASCLLSSVGLPLIVLLLLLQAAFLLDELQSANGECELRFYIKGAISLTALSLLLLPELFFLDDPYGGENERMNTIFKAYSSDWAFLSLYAIFSASDAFKKFIDSVELRKILAPIFAVSMAALTLPFVFHTAFEREMQSQTILPLAQGLSSLDNQYHGAAEAIKAFYAAPDGLTAEAPGNPYSLTSHVCTLAGKRCYIGWKNHVDLLTRKYDESKRREDVVNQIFATSNCAFTKTIMEREKIDYIVIGPLERQRYGSVDENNYSCLTTIVTNSSYSVFKR